MLYSQNILRGLRTDGEEKEGIQREGKEYIGMLPSQPKIQK